MNSVSLIGRLTKDPEVRYTSAGSETPIARFTLAIDGFPRKDGTKHTDFPQIVVFNKQAESCGKHLKKGRLCGVTGRITTGSYKNKNGDTVYTTEVAADRVEFLEWGEKKEEQPTEEWKQAQQSINETLGISPSFQAIDDDIPF